MTAADTMLRPPTAAEYDALAEADTAAGWTAWNDGRIKRATFLWQSAARWSQYAAKARGGVR